VGTASRRIRLVRVRRGAIPPLRMALDAGEISLFRASEIARLPLQKQPLAVEQWSHRSLRRTQGQAIAAQAIREALTRGSKIDLAEVLEAIRSSVASSGTETMRSSEHRHCS